MPNQLGTIGFIGIGNMGWHMAANLSRAGCELLAWDINADARRHFASEFGTRLPDRVCELAAASIIITMLPTGAVVDSVLHEGGPASLLESLKPGTMIIDTTSSVPTGTRARGDVLAQSGVALLDASVSGGRKGAIEGSLVFMVGCDDEAVFARAKPVLSAMGHHIFRVGPLGAGNVMKSLNNFVSAAGYVAACEALIVGAQHGLSPATMVDILNLSTGRNFATETSMTRIVDRNFVGNFSLGLFTKDIRIAADLADEKGVTAPLTHLVHDRMDEAMRAVGGGGDHTTAYPYWETQVRQ